MQMPQGCLLVALSGHSETICYLSAFGAKRTLGNPDAPLCWHADSGYRAALTLHTAIYAADKLPTQVYNTISLDTMSALLPIARPLLRQ